LGSVKDVFLIFNVFIKTKDVANAQKITGNLWKCKRKGILNYGISYGSGEYEIVSMKMKDTKETRFY
jgi:hypothetical protein